jgi:methionyl-tRNA formyltransferase
MFQVIQVPMGKIKIGYFGDGPWAHKSLARLLQDSSIEVEFVCVRNDMPDKVLEQIANKAGIDFLTHQKVNSSDFIELASKYRCDLFISMSFDQIFGEKIRKIPPLSIINCHAGKLPFYKGRNVLNWVLINDEKEFGITVHYVDEKIDTGDIILQQTFSISDEDNYSTLLLRAYDYCSIILYDAVKMIQDSRVKVIKQSELSSSGFYCVLRKQGDEILNWEQSSRSTFNFIRAICRPGPEARTFFGDIEIKINQAEYLSDADNFVGIPGSVIGVSDDSFIVKTSDSYIRITEWSGYLKPRIGDRLR